MSSTHTHTQTQSERERERKDERERSIALPRKGASRRERGGERRTVRQIRARGALKHTHTHTHTHTLSPSLLK